MVKRDETIGVIIQARMGSSRLPGKVMTDIVGKPLIAHVIDRASLSKTVDKVILATTDKPEDDPLAEYCKKENIACFRGDEDDVLDRYFQAAKLFELDHIVRVTGDCPLVDPNEIDKLNTVYLEGDYDYVSNTTVKKLPDGLDASIGSFKAFEKSWNESKLASDREHVTQYIRTNPNLFKIGVVPYTKDYSSYRLTVDYKEDLEVVKKIFSILDQRKIFGHLEELIDILKSNPELVDLNSEFERNEGLIKSLKSDKIVK